MKVNFLKVKSDQYQTTVHVVQMAFINAAHSDHDEHHLIDRLRNSPSYEPAFDMLAETSTGEIIGHVMLSPATTVVQPKSARGILVLAPLAVLPEYQGHGVGRRLIETVEQRAIAASWSAISILGDPEYYGRFDYVPASQFGIEAPFEVPDDYFMVRELSSNALAGFEGKLQYDTAFGIN